MMRINLLPHRQIKRAEKQRQFGLMALFSAVLGCAIVFAGWTYLSAKKQVQEERNARLEALQSADAAARNESESVDWLASQWHEQKGLERGHESA